MQGKLSAGPRQSWMELVRAHVLPLKGAIPMAASTPHEVRGQEHGQSGMRPRPARSRGEPGKACQFRRERRTSEGLVEPGGTSEDLYFALIAECTDYRVGRPPFLGFGIALLKPSLTG